MRLPHRIRSVAVAAVVAAVVAPVAAAAGEATGFSIVPGGGAAHGDAAYCNNCDVIGVRNIQGGTAHDLNLDIGAGSTQTPGDVSLNYDIGRCTKVWDGRKELVASFCPQRTVFYGPVEFKQRARFRSAVHGALRRPKRP
jgi:hypothetical protein